MINKKNSLWMFLCGRKENQWKEAHNAEVAYIFQFVFAQILLCHKISWMNLLLVIFVDLMILDKKVQL